VALGNAQLAANVGTAESQAQLNNLNTFSPYGSTQYTGNAIDPSTGKPTSYNVNQSLSPELQNLFGTQTSLASALAGGAGTFAGAAPGLGSLGASLINRAGGMAGNLPTGLDLSSVPNVGMLTPGSFRTDVTGGAGGQAIPGAVTSLPLQTSVNSNFPQLVKQAQDAAYGQQTQYLDPQFSQQEETLRQSLADQGIEEGSPAFSRALGDFNRQKQMAYGNAQDQAVQAGNEQQRSLFAQAIAGGQFTNQALATGGAFTNQAQQQLFGQGLSLSDLYNQAVLGASGQNLQATGANLARSQAAFGAPYTAAEGITNLGTSIYGTGLGSLGAVLPGVTAWPTGPTGIPNLAPGAATGVSPANIVGAQQAATGQNQLANVMRQQNLTGIGSLASSLLGGGGSGGIGTSLFGSGGLSGALGGGSSGGLFGSLFGGGATDAAASAGLDWGAAIPFLGL
jgi:hypothetical protein